MEIKINSSKLTFTFRELQKSFDFSKVEDNFPGFYWIEKSINHYLTYQQIDKDCDNYFTNHYEDVIKKKKELKNEKEKEKYDKLDREIKEIESSYAMIRAIKYILYKSGEYQDMMKLRTKLFSGMCCNNVSGFICLGCGNIICQICDKFHERILKKEPSDNEERIGKRNNEYICKTYIWNILV